MWLLRPITCALVVYVVNPLVLITILILWYICTGVSELRLKILVPIFSPFRPIVGEPRDQLSELFKEANLETQRKLASTVFTYSIASHDHLLLLFNIQS